VLCQGLTRIQANELYLEALDAKDNDALRRLCLEDLFFLLTVGCKRKDINRDWLYERCREVEANPNGHLDLWAREHYKSTVITFGKSIQDILNDPNITIGIFSHTRPIAKAFLKQIKTELEANTFLKNLFPEILYQNPSKEAARWSLDEGIRVKRTQNPKEETIEAWGLVDGQPTSKHYKLLLYDDVVTRESVTTPDQIKKTTEAWELSLDLGAEGGKRRTIGTRYHMHDTYKVMMDRGSVTPRVHAATSNGKMDGEPVFLSRERLAEKRRDQGPYTFSCQQLLNPVADSAMSFKEEWLRYYDSLGDTDAWNKYIIVDPASKRKKNSDYTVMKVIGLAPDNNYYLIAAIRDRLSLTGRADKLFELHREHQPLDVGYEEYGMQADIEHMQYVMEQKNYRFNITPLGGAVAKEDRIKMLVPPFEQSRVWIPRTLYYFNYEGKRVDYISQLLDDEYKAFPVCIHDDMMDCLARILDPGLGAQFPKIAKPKPVQRAYASAGGNGWMG
jgi:phage terminase large subunit-like protein